MTSLDRIAAYVVEAKLADMNDAVRDKARVFLLDSLGVGIAGSSGEGVAELTQTVGSFGDGDEATVWVTGERLPATSAAIVNAYQLHCLEYDCVHEGAVVHPMATVLSASLAHAEKRSADGCPVSGPDFLVALAVGVEVATLLGVAAEGPVRFFRPATAGGFGAAAALAKLEGLDEKAVKDTLGITYGQTSGTLQPHAEGSPVLGMQIGFNARGALTAVALAKAGFRGPHEILDGAYGYFRMFEDNRFDLEAIWSRLGREWQIAQLAHKPFPSGRLTHGVLDALRQLEAKGIARDDIVGINGDVPLLVYRLVSRPDQPDPASNYAKLCLAYVAGAWIARGNVDVPEFRAPVLTDPTVHKAAAMVSLKQDDNPDENALVPQKFTFSLADGRKEIVELKQVYGHPDVPLSPEENEAKFRRCITYGAKMLRTRQGDDLVTAVDGIEDLDDVADLARLTVAP